MCKMEDTIQVAGLQDDSIVDGPGFRFVVFTQGCPHHCPGCHNPQTHPFQGGETVTIGEILERIQSNPLLKGVTLSGGEPFCQPAPLAELARQVHALGKDVVCYSGFTLEQLLEKRKTEPSVGALLEETDLLIDGPFLQDQKDLTLLFRGSANQRLIQVKPTLETGNVVLWEPEW